MSKFKIGDKVKYISKNHREMPEFYPKIGTIGTVVNEGGDTDWYIQWPKGSTSGKDCWYCDENDIELVESVDMTNEEIWEMLRPKMEKNSLKSVASIIHTSTDKDCSKFNLTHVYAEDDVHNAIALAYKVGYLRAMKGRPFKIGEKKVEEKKQGGHWEPVDPENLPKEGTKVRYSRECGAYSNDIIKIGDTGVVVWEGMFTPMWFGMKPDLPRSYLTWLDFDNGAESCLDIWVEDDE